MGVASMHLFSGGDGPTSGFEADGFYFRAGFGLAPSWKRPYEEHDFSVSHPFDMGSVDADNFENVSRGAVIRILVGRASQQTVLAFGSAIAGRPIAYRWPTPVTIKNVPELAEHEAYTASVNGMRTQGCAVANSAVECANKIARFIGDADPMRLGRMAGRRSRKHLKKFLHFSVLSSQLERGA